MNLATLLAELLSDLDEPIPESSESNLSAIESNAPHPPIHLPTQPTNHPTQHGRTEPDWPNPPPIRSKPSKRVINLSRRLALSWTYDENHIRESSWHLLPGAPCAWRSHQPRFFGHRGPGAVIVLLPLACLAEVGPDSRDPPCGRATHVQGRQPPRPKAPIASSTYKTASRCLRPPGRFSITRRSANASFPRRNSLVPLVHQPTHQIPRSRCNGAELSCAQGPGHGGACGGRTEITQFRTTSAPHQSKRARIRMR